MCCLVSEALQLFSVEMLTSASPIQGVSDKIATLRARHKKVKSSLSYYEALVAEQSQQLRQMNRPSSRISEYDDDDDVPGTTGLHNTENVPITAEDLKREEESVRELEQKKQTLEDRVNGMEKDLGGILR